MKAIKNIAIAIVMTIIGTATTYANTTVIKHNNHKPVAVVVHNNHHCKECKAVHARDHRHLSRPVMHCNCKHCVKLNAKIEKEMRRHAEEMRRLEAKKHSVHPEVNARTGHVAYNGRR